MLVLVSLCLLFEDVNAQTTKNRYYKANDENVSYVGRTEIQSDGSVSFDWTGTYLRTRLSGGELSMKISDTGINYYNHAAKTKDMGASYRHAFRMSLS